MDQNDFPGVTRDQEGITRYAATILVTGRTNANALMDKIAMVTARRALGSRSVKMHIEVGNTGTLSVPAHAGSLKSYTAAIVKCDPVADGRYTAGYYWMDCEWIIESDITPT